MEQVLQVTALCVIGTLLAVVVKRGSPELALTLTLSGVVVGLLLVAGAMGDVMSFLKDLGERSGVSSELFLPLYKTVGIALVVRVGGNLCRDAGESALATVVEMAGSICALVAALPLLRAVLSLLLELME